MPSLVTMIDLIGKLDSEFITVHQERCCMVRNVNAQCFKCAEVCTSDCISFNGEEICIKAENCIGCGTCATVCPTCALEAHNPNDAQLFTECERSAEHLDGRVVVGCATLLAKAVGYYDTQKVVRVECLGRIEETLLTTLAACGISEVVLVHGECEKCVHKTGRALLDTVLENENVLLEAWNTTLPIRVTTKLPSSVRNHEEGFNKSKRAAFEQGIRGVSQVGVTTINYVVDDFFEQKGQDDGKEPAANTPAQLLKVMADGTLPHFIPDRRERLLDALASLGEPQDVMINTRLWGHVIIDTQACTSCRMCAVFCPTAALRKFEREDGTIGVEHYPGDCVKCHTCEAICPGHCLEISEEVFAREMLAGKTDEYTMKPLEVEVGSAHTIWNKYKNLATIAEVYER